MPIYEFKGKRPKIGSNVFIADNAAVIGDVELGDNVSIWFSCTLRGDVFPIRVGARTNIQDGSVIHVTEGMASTTIGCDVTVGHMAMIHGCTIGDGALVGMGSVVLDHATIGEKCFLAGGSLVVPNSNLPPKTMCMGRPAKAVRPLTDEDFAWLVGSAKHYDDLAAIYRDPKQFRRIDI